MKYHHALGMAPLLFAASFAHALSVPVDQDYMSTGFFFGPPFLRGQESSSSRTTNRVTSPVISGITGETAYFSFDFDPSAFSGPVPQATLTVENVATGFFTDVSDTNPADISIHRLTADPLAVINTALGSGPGSWLDFRDTQITVPSVVDTISIDSFGVNTWDITSLVNEWIANGDANFAYTVGTSALLDPEGGAAVAFVNSSFNGLAGTETTARIDIIPEPASIALLGLGGAMVFARRRR
ncbi:MAG: PEP-CTERM sorting domain-containing protein [Planctomycetota bacterium]